MKKLLITIAIVMLLPVIATACGMGEKTAQGYENASIMHAHDHWKQGKQSPIPFTFIDVRTAKEFAQGHISGAVLIPIEELAKRINEVPHDRQVYLYCHSGTRSARAATLLAKHGFTRIENIVGGIVAWKAKGYEVTQ